MNEDDTLKIKHLITDLRSQLEATKGQKRDDDTNQMFGGLLQTIVQTAAAAGDCETLLRWIEALQAEYRNACPGV